MSLNYILDQGTEPDRWTNLNVNSLKTRSLVVFTPPTGTVTDFYLNNATGDDLNDGLTAGTPVQTWVRLLEVASSNPGDVCVLNIDGSGSFDPTSTITPPVEGADCLWSLRPLDDVFDYIIIRGVRKDPVTLTQGAGVDAPPFDKFRQWGGLSLGGVNYDFGISRWEDVDGNYGFEAVSSVDAADTVTICGTNSNTHGGELHLLGGPQIAIDCVAAIVSANPVVFESLRFSLIDSAIEPNASLRNRTIQPIVMSGCEVDTLRKNYFSGDYSVKGCSVFSATLDPTKSGFMIGANLSSLRNSHIVASTMTVRTPIRMSDNRHDDAKVRIENTLCESVHQLHVSSVEDCWELDSAILDIFALECTNSSNDSDHHCIDAERSKINANRISCEKTSALGRCLNAESQTLAQFSDIQSFLNSNVGSLGVCIRVRNGSYCQMTPASDSGGVTRDFKIVTAGSNPAVDVDTYSQFVVLPYGTRNATANPAEISTVSGIDAIEVDFNSSIRLPPLLGQQGDLIIASSDNGIRLRRMSSANIQDNSYTNQGAGLNIIHNGGQPAVTTLTSGQNAADLATGITNEGCGYYVA